jgi:hypothetical protein
MKENIEAPPAASTPSSKKFCYQCDAEVIWLAPDSRCWKCTRVSPEDAEGPLEQAVSLQPGVRYIVTRDSKNKEFQRGDHIWLDERDGSILCREVFGWVPAEYVADATEGMEVAVDTDWIAKQRERLERQLAALHQHQIGDYTAASPISVPGYTRVLLGGGEAD